MHIKWSDYLSTAIMRAVFGAIIGIVISVPLIFFGGSMGRHYGGKRSLLVGWIQDGNYRALLFWFGAWGIGGAIIAVVTIPRWQTPWYKGVLDDEDDQTRKGPPA